MVVQPLVAAVSATSKTASRSSGRPQPVPALVEMHKAREDGLKSLSGLWYSAMFLWNIAE